MNVLDLFCGCGGMSLGFEKSAYNIVGAYDFWEPAINTYNANLSHKAEAYDLSDVDGFLERIAGLKVDLVIGGPPCQDFSSAGHRKERKRANLTLSYAEIISRIKPSYLVMENVARTRNSRTYQEARDILVGAGYGLSEKVIDSNFCRVPQIRKRFFCIGALGEADGFLDDVIQRSLGKERMTVRDYLGHEIDVDHYYRHPRNYNRRGVFSVDEPSMTIRGVNRPVPGGYTGHPGDTAPIDDNLRPLTTKERSRIQTFPSNFRWLGSKTDLEQMIGNAVPVNLAIFVAECISKFEKSKFKAEKVA